MRHSFALPHFFLCLIGLAALVFLVVIPLVSQLSGFFSFFFAR